MSRQAVISPSVAPVHKEPEFSSEMISQALMWEKVKIKETYENWHQIKMEDGYDGWIHSFYLLSFALPTELTSPHLPSTQYSLSVENVSLASDQIDHPKSVTKAFY